MNDDELTRLFRSLDEPAEPRTAFADELFASLEHMASGAVARRRTSVRWLLVAATLLLVASLGAALAVGSGLIKLPFVSDVAESPTPTSSGSPFPSTPTLPSASPLATPLPTASIPEPTSIGGLVATPDGFLAWGSAYPQGQSGPTDQVILRASSDGSSWQSMDTSRFTGEVVGMAVGPSAWILLSNPSPTTGLEVVLWRSTDGENWTSNSAWTSDTIASPLALSAGPSGFAISGAYLTGPGRVDNTVWTSPDGVRWTRGAINLGYTGGSALVLDNGFVAYQSGQFGDTPAIFASRDGTNWESVSSPAGSGHEVIAGLVQVGSNLVAVTCSPGEPDGACNVSTGSLEGSAGSLAIHWQADTAATQELHGYAPTATTAAGSRGFIYAYDLGTFTRVVLSSSDGQSWTRTALAADAFGGGLPNPVAGQSAVVGVGWTESTPAGIGRDLWRSTDGTTWSPASAPLVPPAAQVPGGDCAPAPTTVQQLVEIGFVKAAACYANQSLTLQGYSSGCGGCGGIPGALLTPDWMAAAYSYGAWYISPQNTKTTPEGARLAVNLLPSANLSPPGEGVPVTVTGHFNDPASQDCRIVPVHLGVELPPTSEAIGRCQRSFVVTSISVSGG